MKRKKESKLQKKTKQGKIMKDETHPPWKKITKMIKITREKKIEKKERRINIFCNLIEIFMTKIIPNSTFVTS